MKGCHVTLALALAASCGGSEPSSSPPPPPPPPGPIRPAAQGAVRLLRPGFAFLPPLVPASAGSSPFDAGLTPTIVVCELQDNACTTTVGTFPAVLDQALEEYALTWSTANLDQSRGYRIRVNLWSLELGSLDLDIVSSSAELASVDANRFVGVVKGTELPIRFRIEEPALWSGLPALTSNRSSAPPGGMLVLSGFDVSPLAQEKLSLVVGPAPAPMTSNAPAGVAAAVPLFLDATLNSRPPQGPQHVVLLENGVPRAGARRALTLTALPDAPGASESALAALRPSWPT
jgi:hypothetical protein